MAHQYGTDFDEDDRSKYIVIIISGNYHVETSLEELKTSMQKST